MNMNTDRTFGISNALMNINATLNSIKSDLRSVRRRNWVLAISVAFDILLSVGLGVALHQTNNDAAVAHLQVVSRCQTNNDFRVKNEKLWNYVIAESQSQVTTPMQQAALDRIRKQVVITYALSDCQHIQIGK